MLPKTCGVVVAKESHESLWNTVELTWRFMGSYKWGYKWGNYTFYPY